MVKYGPTNSVESSSPLDLTLLFTYIKAEDGFNRRFSISLGGMKVSSSSVIVKRRPRRRNGVHSTQPKASIKPTEMSPAIM